MNKEKIKRHFANQLGNDIVKIAASYIHDPELANAMQDAINGITASVCDCFIDSLCYRLQTGEDAAEALTPKNYCNTLAAEHLTTIIKLCPSCDALQVLHDLREVARLVLLSCIAQMKIRLLPETETETN
jgi:hypothetical protein